jgi:hypothetical protein
MATNNANDFSNPLAISQGGTNAASMATVDGTAYYNGTSIVVTNTGTAGQLLTSNGPGVAPTWQTHSGSGSATGLGWDLIETKTFASMSFTLNFTTGISAPYNIFMVLYSQGTDPSMQIRYSTNGGVSYVSSGYNSTNQRQQIGVVASALPDFSNSGIVINSGSSPASGSPWGSTVYLFNITSGGRAYAVGLGNNLQTQNMCVGSFGNSAAINALQFVGNLASSPPTRVSLYGLNQ